MTLYGYIYKTVNLVNGKVYIGQHTKDKFNSNYKGSGDKIQYAIKKYGKKNFSTELLEFVESKDVLDKREIFYISETRKLTGKDNVYNITVGGKGLGAGVEHPVYGRRYSEEIRAKHRGKNSPNFGKTMSIETRNKLSVALSGKNNPMFGKQRTEEFKKLIKNRMTGNKNPMFGKRGEQSTFYGRKHTLESIEKMRSHPNRPKFKSGKENPMYGLGNKHPMFGKTGNKNPWYGHKHSKETKERIRLTSLNRKHSEETKEKMRQSWKVRKAKKAEL